MSVRAYRLIEIKLEDKPSFNLWHDQKLRDFLEAEADIFSHLDSDGTGMTEVPVKTLKKAVGKVAELNLDAKTIDQLKKDITAAKFNKDEYVTYYCL